MSEDGFQAVISRDEWNDSSWPNSDERRLALLCETGSQQVGVAQALTLII